MTDESLTALYCDGASAATLAIQEQTNTMTLHGESQSSASCIRSKIVGITFFEHFGDSSTDNYLAQYEGTAGLNNSQSNLKHLKIAAALPWQPFLLSQVLAVSSGIRWIDASATALQETALTRYLTQRKSTNAGLSKGNACLALIDATKTTHKLDLRHRQGATGCSDVSAAYFHYLPACHPETPGLSPYDKRLSPQAPVTTSHAAYEQSSTAYYQQPRALCDQALFGNS